MEGNDKPEENETKKEDDAEKETPTKKEKKKVKKSDTEMPPHLLSLISILDQANSQPRSAQ